MLTRDEIIRDLENTGALLNGHFLLSSGLHSEAYVQCASLLKYPHLADKFARELVKKLEEFEVDMVLGPALGGVIISYEVARVIGVPGIFCERKKGKMMLRRNFQINPGQKVLVVEDVITTGGSVKEVLEIIDENGGKTVAVASIIDRTGNKDVFDIPFISLIELNFEVYKPEECLLCRQGSQAVKPGSRF